MQDVRWRLRGAQSAESSLILFELFFEVIIEVGLELLGQVAGELIFQPPVDSAIRRTTWARAVRSLSLVVLGAAVGWATVLIYPTRVLTSFPVTGLSLVIIPVATASIMALIGRHRKAARDITGTLWSFWPAFDFAFGITVARFLLLDSLK